MPKPWVALGAHYDHLGRGSHGNSLARQGRRGQDPLRRRRQRVGHGRGARRRACAGEEAARRGNVMLGFWSAEEIGLIGSNAFVDDAARAGSISWPRTSTSTWWAACRTTSSPCRPSASSPAWRPLIERANVAAGFDLVLQDDPYQPTDVASFNQAGVPSLAFFTGTHVDYHKPSDTADKINYEDLDRVVDFAVALASRVGEQPEALAFAKVEQSGQQAGGGRAGVRIFTGTIPDYATDVKGLLLGGVIGGGPAEQAGLQKGDVIVQIGGQTIANIYDYTYALEVLKVGQPVKVVYMRNGERKETTLTPGARK